MHKIPEITGVGPPSCTSHTMLWLTLQYNVHALQLHVMCKIYYSNFQHNTM